MPDLVSRAVREGLYTHVVGRRILYYPELGSTMDEAARLAAEYAEEGTVVIAGVQTAGRGRQGRSWVSRPGNLLVSVLFRPTFHSFPTSVSSAAWPRPGRCARLQTWTPASSGPTT